MIFFCVTSVTEPTATVWIYCTNFSLIMISVNQCTLNHHSYKFHSLPITLHHNTCLCWWGTSLQIPEWGWNIIMVWLMDPWVWRLRVLWLSKVNVNNDHFICHLGSLEINNRIATFTLQINVPGMRVFLYLIGPLCWWMMWDISPVAPQLI